MPLKHVDNLESSWTLTPWAPQNCTHTVFGVKTYSLTLPKYLYVNAPVFLLSGDDDDRGVSHRKIVYFTLPSTCAVSVRQNVQHYTINWTLTSSTSCKKIYLIKAVNVTKSLNLILKQQSKQSKIQFIVKRNYNLFTYCLDLWTAVILKTSGGQETLKSCWNS